MAETTEQYQNRINQIKTVIEKEPRIREMRDAIAEGISKTGNRQADVEKRQATVETAFQQIIDEMTDKDVASAPEIIAARSGYPSLAARLAAQVADMDEMDERITTKTQEMSGQVTDLEERVNTEIAEVLEQTGETINAFKEITVNIKDFGAVYDNPAFDNMPIISAAQDYVVAHGGGIIYFPDEGVLYVKPVLRLKNGVSLLGAKSRPVIKVCPDVTNFYGVFLIEYVNHVSIKNLTIDSNKENRSNYDISKNPQILISVSEAKYVDVEDNTLIGNGVWVYAVFTGGDTDYSRYLNLNRNHIIWKAGLSSHVGGPPGVDVDNTTVYFDALDYNVIGNTIETADGLKNMTCIEAHGANATVRDNVIKGFRAGIIVWSLVAQPLDGTVIHDNNIDVIDNKFIDVEAGVHIGATSNAQYGTFNITGVNVLNNQILLNPGRFKRGSSRGIHVYVPYNAQNGWGRKIKIANNTIDSIIDPNTYPSAESVYLFTGIELISGRLSEVTIFGNTVKNISGIGLLINNGIGLELDLNDSSIFGNTFIDCGRNTNIAFDGFNHRTAMTILRKATTRLNRVTIGVNYIYDSRATGTYFTRAVHGLLATDDDQVVKTKSRENWVGRYNEPMRLQADISNLYVSPNTTLHTTLTKDRCIVSAYAYIGEPYAGEGLYLHLPVEADISADMVGGNWQLYKVDGTVQTGFFRINGEHKKIAWLKYPDLEANVLGANDRLQLQLEYPVTVVQKYIPR